ncbi:MAG: C10 family peptidase [Prevotella sp.]
MYRRKLLLMLSALMVGIIAIAAPRTAEQAKIIAIEQARKLGIEAARPLLLVNASPRRANAVGSNAAIYYYVFNNEGGNGFTIVSGDDLMPEIVGYSDRGSFSEDNMPGNVKSFLHAYEQTLDNVAEGDYSAIQIVDELKARRAGNTDVYTVGDILLGEMTWGQDGPYNLMCPVFIDERGFEYKCVTGCCATAVSQIMRYHKWPKELTVDIPDYTTEYFGEEYQWEGVKVEPEGHPYDWDNILERYLHSEGKPTYSDIQATAVAQLLSDVGRAVKMEYHTSFSGTWEDYPLWAMPKYFDYDPDLIQMIYRCDVSLSQWIEVLKRDIDEKRPICMSGSSAVGGHQFVCDGYDNNGLFHINWGWDGFCNGFFDITILNPYTPGTSVSEDKKKEYNRDNMVIVGIQPNNGIVDSPLWDFPSSGIENVSDRQTGTNQYRQNETYTISGKRVSSPKEKGIYIIGKKKVLVK